MMIASVCSQVGVGKETKQEKTQQLKRVMHREPEKRGKGREREMQNDGESGRVHAIGRSVAQWPHLLNSACINAKRLMMLDDAWHVRGMLVYTVQLRRCGLCGLSFCWRQALDGKISTPANPSQGGCR